MFVCVLFACFVLFAGLLMRVCLFPIENQSIIDYNRFILPGSCGIVVLYNKSMTEVLFSWKFIVVSRLGKYIFSVVITRSACYMVVGNISLTLSSVWLRFSMNYTHAFGMD